MDISALGEFELIARLTAGLATRAAGDVGIGDDCALLDLGSGDLLLATCDCQVEGVHFTLQTSSPEHIGRKALAINLSDIAAMGGTPRYALVSLLLPPHLSVDVLDGIYAGLRAEAQRFDTTIVGGNIAGTGAAQQLVIDITLLGTVARGHAILRSGARVGDLICVTGSLGDSAAGLQTFLRPATDAVLPHDLQALRGRHTAPLPRVHEGQLLASFKAGQITAMLDISDGLSGDLTHLCERSGCGARVDLATIPLSTPLSHVAQALQHDPLDWALHGGEDYELLFTLQLPSLDEVRTALQEQCGTPLTVIGEIQPLSAGLTLAHSNGHTEPLHAHSWDHLKPKK
ncbi:thiamine-phosphate kinase [Dictyobacter formicarum]|uniref:Thiamine-monophosphate kinase n=1 Tax=Dictyobacter formicarum TaxID=2778368 RepID=A0ABQ3VHB3_9CHLR|nr:thiamine-phosphate kinase [Dictyobacter formicarum]GHO84511.1 thiamine-monophosphate kinase [Dictyobacter formicarum]